MLPIHQTLHVQKFANLHAYYYQKVNEFFSTKNIVVLQKKLCQGLLNVILEVLGLEKYKCYYAYF